MNRLILTIPIFALALALISACDDNEREIPEKKTDNPAAYITDEAKLKMLRSFKDIDIKSEGRIYEMNYSVDYKLDEALKAEPILLEDLTKFMAVHLFDKLPTQRISMGYGAACSAFAVPDPESGNFLMGRNFDFCHVDPQTRKEVPISAIVVHATSAEGKKSVSMVDSYWLGLKKGFYTDGKSDLSVLMALPYVMMDGMNEDGFAIGVLHLGGEPTMQNAPGKLKIATTVAMRMLLDRASTVDEAIELLKQYNMHMESSAGGNYHYFMADATGNYAIIEYVFDDAEKKGNPNNMKVFNMNDTMRYVTNFYVTPMLEQDGEIGGCTERGRKRYDTMKETLKMNVYRLNERQAMALLESVATDADTQENTSHTQWSSLYNLSKKTLDVAILKEYEVNERHHFTVK